MAHASGNPAWQNYPNTSTPIDADALEQVETVLDRYASPPFGHAGRTAGFQNASAGGTVGVAAQELSGGMTFANDALVVPVAGMYLVTGCPYATGGSAIRYTFGFQRNGAAWDQSPSLAAWKGDAGDHKQTVSGVRKLDAGDRISIVVQVPGHSTWGSDGFNGVWFEVLHIGAPTTPDSA